MGKSILVIDMPDACVNCPCHFATLTGKVVCGAHIENQKEILAENIETFKPDWCPLQEFPEPKVKRKNSDDYSTGFVNGFNRCLREISS